MRADISDARNERQLLAAALFESLEARGNFCFLLGDIGEAFGMIDADGSFALENALLHVEIIDLAHGIFDQGRRGVLPEEKRRAQAVSMTLTRSFVWELASSEIAMRELGGGADRFIEDPDVMVFFQRADNAAQHDHALFFGGLFDFDDLKAASEGGVFLEEFLVLGPGGGGDGAEFAARQGRFE